MMKFLLALALLASTCAASLAEPVKITVDRTRVEGTSRLELGVTHTQRGLDTGGDAASIARAKEMLGKVARGHNVHIMGWGTMNPNPAPGQYDWASLDRRMEMVASIPNAVPVITLCAAPDWMKGGEAGKTDWKRIEAAPLPQHYKDFAKLAAAVAKRYPQAKYFQVWNEMKGMWKAPINNWDYEGYTQMYNEVYDALKAVSRDIKVGGPYLVIEDTGGSKTGTATGPPISARNRTVIEYWLKNKRGADFITLDRSIKSYHDKNAYTTAEKMALTHWFGDIARQVRAMTDLPIWWAEYYAETDEAPEVVAALHASVLNHMLRSDTSVALLWQPMQAGEVSHALFTDVKNPNGAQSLPYFRVFEMFRDHFGPGTKYFAASSTSSDVEVLASAAKTLLINKSGEAVEVEAEGQKRMLEAYQVLAVDAAGTR